MTPTEKIDALIKARGLSRRKVAIMANIPPSTLQSAIERNKNLSTDMLRKIAIALDVSLSDLLWDGEGLIPDDTIMLMVGQNGTEIVDSKRSDAISLRKLIIDDATKLVKNLNIANMDDLWDIQDHLEKCIDIIKARKQKEKAPEVDPEP